MEDYNDIFKLKTIDNKAIAEKYTQALFVANRRNIERMDERMDERI